MPVNARNSAPALKNPISVTDKRDAVSSAPYSLSPVDARPVTSGINRPDGALDVRQDLLRITGRARR
jgi:hypothetical protein